MKFMYSILVSCLLFIGQAQAANFNLLDATSFDPQPVVVSAVDNSVPVGTVIIWTKEVIPDGWLECDGQVVNETLYPDLHKLMPNTPNYQGMFLRGAGSQSFIQNAGYMIGNTQTLYSSGNLGTIQGDSIRNHKGVLGTADGPAMGPLFGGNNRKSMAYSLGIAHDGGQRAGSQDTMIGYDFSRVFPTSNEIRPVNIAVKYIIKAE